MTVEEAYQSYGAKKAYTGVNDSIVFLSRRLYGSNADIYLNILRVLNYHVNWLNMQPGIVIYYLDPSVVNDVVY